VKHSEAVDELTLDVYLKRFNAAQLDWSTELVYEGIPIEAIKNKSNPVVEDYSAGPYKVIKREKGVATILERFDKFYNLDEGVAPRIGIRPITEMNARMAALEAEEVDYIDNLSADAAEYLRGVKGVDLKERNTLYV
jgi:ABC-type transport system substrate-binding protein